MLMARLLSVNVGLPRDVDWRGKVVHTGIWKQPMPGRCRVWRLNLDGDGQGDLAGHGRCAGPAGRGSVTRARAGWSPGASPTTPSRSIRQPRATSSPAARGRAEMS